MYGGFGHFGHGVHIDKTFSGIPPHQMLLIKFKLFKIDSWDKERFCISFDLKPPTECLWFGGETV